GLIFPPKANAANERLAQHLWAHRGDLFTFLRQPGLDATNWRAELAIRFGGILRKGGGGNPTWAGARAQSGPGGGGATRRGAGGLGPGLPGPPRRGQAGGAGPASRPGVGAGGGQEP